ncbi:YbaK/EbsC family protein [Pseudactinotalea suaedae]|uniref:aminoacyl-tRNA deacylase n=1 Tax=Pseudactinotalea suaedae TaxID=1524924 RepID=UPI0012E1674F
MLVGVSEPDGLVRVRADATARSIPIEVKERPYANSLEEAAAILGISPADIAKSIVMRAGTGQYVFAIVPGDASVSFAKLRALLGVNKLKFPSAQEALDAVGHERGTITPLGSLQEYPTYVDASLTGRRVSMGSGAHGYSVWVDVDDLVRGLGATVADIAG